MNARVGVKYEISNHNECQLKMIYKTLFNINFRLKT